MVDTKISGLDAATLTEADEFAVNDGGTTKKATTAELRTAIVPLGFIPLNFFSAREVQSNEIPNQATLAGGILGADTTPILERISGATDKGIRLHWIVDGVEEIQFEPIPMPPDLDETVDVTIHLVAESGSTDTPVIDVQVYDGVGDTEMGGNSGALADAITEVTVTIANADISGGPTGFFNISLVPAGHSTDPIFLYAAWIEYTRKLPV